MLGRHLTRLFGTDLTLIPGIGDNTALTLFAEIGSDLSRFPDASHFASVSIRSTGVRGTGHIRNGVLEMKCGRVLAERAWLHGGVP
ncbi:MAG: transposase [Candidatus Dadabacteria bacterium]|nr:transposase [Candidatus Dadabacteria bacterium]